MFSRLVLSRSTTMTAMPWPFRRYVVTAATTTTPPPSPSSPPAILPPNMKVVDPVVLKPVVNFTYLNGDKVPKEKLLLHVLPPLFISVEEDKLPEHIVELSRRVFASDVRPDIMARVVRWQRARWQQGTHSSKTKAEVTGTRRKPYNQKGTGKARQGSWLNPHIRGGGAAFGPHPRSHEHSMNKKERRFGLRSALSARLQEGKVFVMDSFELPPDTRAKTKIVASAMYKYEWVRPLFIGRNTVDDVVAQGVNNIVGAKYLPSIGCNVYDVLKFKEVVFAKDALKELEERLMD